MITEEQNTLLQNWVHAFWTEHNPDILPATFTDDVIYRDVAAGLYYKGHEQVRQYLMMCVGVIPDFGMEIRHAKNVGRDVLAATWDYWGTMKFGTHEQFFKLPGHSVLTLRDGKIATCFDYYDGKDWVDAIGFPQYELLEFNQWMEDLGKKKIKQMIAKSEVDLEAHLERHAPQVDMPGAIEREA